MRATRSIRTAAGRSGKVRRDDALGAPCVYAARFPRANQALVEDRCDRRKRRSVHPAAYGRSGYRWQNNNRLTERVKGPLVYCDGRIATDKALSLAPLISSTNGLAEISYFMVLRIPSQSVAPLKPLGFRACPSWITSTQAPADRLMV